jgi:hypothetical protein
MSRTLLTLGLVFFLPAALPASPDKKEPRKASPFAPSLPQLSDKEEEAIDRIVDRFVLFDTGRLRGAEGRKALREFQALGPEAIFGLIRGLNRAAQIDASCPALTIGKKIASILRGTRDPELLEYARENIGAGVTRTRHGAVLRDLRVVCTLRKAYLARSNLTPRPRKPSPKSLHSLSVPELRTALTTAHGPRLRQILAELVVRDGDEVISALHSAAATKDREVGPLGQSALVRHLSRLSSEKVKDRLKDERVVVRVAAAKTAGLKRYPLGAELTDRLGDTSPEVRRAAHQALVKLARGADYGPKPDASEGERAEAVKKWRAWCDRQGK